MRHAFLPFYDIAESNIYFRSRDPKVYLGCLHHLSVAPERCAMVAAHIYDLRAAAKHGLRTVYVRRPTEDVANRLRESVKPKSEGGEVDVVVDTLEELAELMGAAKGNKK